MLQTRSSSAAVIAIFLISFFSFSSTFRLPTGEEQELPQSQAQIKPENFAKYSPHKDFLTSHLYIYITLIVALFILQTVVLLCMGQPCISKDNTVEIFYWEVAGSGNSQHIADWYTFTHIVHGLLFHLILQDVLARFAFSFLTVHYSFLVSLITAVVWEIVENTPCVIDRYRQTAIAAGYIGDSVLNSFCDSVAMSAGFWIAYALPWWLTLILILLEELVLGFVIRDNFILNVIQILFSLRCISDWQAKGKRTAQPVPQTDNEERQCES